MPPAALSIRSLHKTYRSGHIALSGIDLTVPQGDFFALLGPNGAGKSTTIGIICALVRATAGSVAVFGHDTVHEANAARQAIGLVPQEFNFNQFEPVDEIVINQAGYYGVPRLQATARAEELLRQLGLWDKRRVMARELSGGMKRRLMIARALVHRPRLLILDEPTAGVDIEIRRSMWAFLREINAAGTTIILTTHYLEEAEMMCRNVAIIDHGRIVLDTDMKGLLARLDTETLVLDLREPCSTPPPLDDCRVALLDPTTLEIEIPRTRPLNHLFGALSALGIDVMSLRNKTNRLEELFLRIVERDGGTH